MWDWWTILAVCAIYFLAGTVKGTIGFGLPIVAVALSAATIGFKEAIALVLVPAFATNVWQAVAGAELAALARRLWSYLAATGLVIYLAGAILAAADAAALSGTLGALMLAYTGLTLAGLRPPPPGRNEVWIAPLAGAVNGLVSGISGMFAIVTGPWLATLGLGRDAIIQALGLVFSFSTVVLAVSMGSRSLLTAELGWLSLAATLPTFAGMRLGQSLRGRLSERLFGKVFLGALAALGGYLVARAVVG